MKKSKNTDNIVLEPENTETNLGTNPKIELISSSDQTFKNPISELQSELELFDSEFVESSLPIEQEQTEIFVPENVQTPEPEKIEEIEPEKIEEIKPEKIEEIKPENGKVEKQEKIEPEKAKKPKTKKAKKVKEQSEQQEEKTPEIQNLKEPEKKKSKKSKVKSEEPKVKAEIQESKEISQPKAPEISITEKSSIKKEVASDLIDINILTKAIPDLQIQSSVLALYNENAELKTNLLKAKKIIAILKKKLDLAEENEEQWRACAYNLGDIFAEKSHMPLEDVLRRFEAPLDDAEV